MATALIDPIIQSSAVLGREGIVFCLGPFAKRVSFSAQQNRALNLIWALHERKHFMSGDPVAVIGGGVAGLTAAAGLIAYGCSVDVFETGKTSVAKQRHTEHRLVHPTVNQWPAAELSLTTKLPFLEWYAGKCSDVTKAIAAQFDDMKGSNRLIAGHEVLEISDIATGLVKLKTSPRLEDPRSYRLVVIAIGFGEEQPSAPFKDIDYWFPDGLEILRDTDKVEEFLVSGCGDGGLIDALRILHRNFKKGQLAFNVAGELARTDLAREITAAESAARVAGSPSGLTDVYERMAGELDTNPAYREVAKVLHASIKDASLIYLIDRDLDDPYSLNAAPIHKLLIAHARRHHLVTYRKGTATLAGDKVHFAGKRIPAPPASHVIIRHGPKVEFGELLSDDEVASLAKQQADKEYLAEPLWPEPYPTPPPMPKRDLADPDFIQSRMKRAKRAVRSLHEDADIMPLAGRLRAIYVGAVPANAPAELFGIPVDNIVRRYAAGIPG